MSSGCRKHPSLTQHLLICIAAAALFAGLAVFTSACSDDTAAAGCATDDECPERQTVCGVKGECIAQTCTTRNDCGTNRACIEGLCSAFECTGDADCEADTRFGAGYVCFNLACQQAGGCANNEACAGSNQICSVFTNTCVDPPATCGSDADCVSPWVCDVATGQCGGSCGTDADCPADRYCGASGDCEVGCREGGCTDGKACDLTTHTCGASCTIAECNALGKSCDSNTGSCVDRTGKGLCESCTLGAHDECGGPNDRCTALGSVNVCAFACQANTDCPTGFECAAITTSTSGCIPVRRVCEGCLVDGCTGTDICNPITGACQAKAAACEACSDDFQCGNAASCMVFQGRTRCLELCGSGDSCPTDTTCNTANNTCEPNSGLCTTCDKVATDCPGQELDEDNCTCVDCVNDSNCSGGQLCAEGIGSCVDGTGHCAGDGDCGNAFCVGAVGSVRQGVCVECLQNSNCGTDASCVNNACISCSCSYPQVCAPDGSCVTPGSCASDTDCENDPSKGPGFVCDTISGLCHEMGMCSLADPSYAPCPAPSSCMDMGGIGMCQGCTGDCLGFTGPSLGCRSSECCVFGSCLAL